MMIFNYILHLSISTFFSSATPNLFGSRKRRKEKQAMADRSRQRLDETFAKSSGEITDEMGRLRAQNPFETAAAKSAMNQSSRKARQTQQRFSNMMGGRTNPESMISSQQATQEAVAGTAGDIAVGAEAQKRSGLAQLSRDLRSERARYASGHAMADQFEQAAINERGAGWRDFYTTFFNPLAGGIKGGASAASQ